MANSQESPDLAQTRAMIAGYYADPATRRSFARDLFNRTAQLYDPVNQLFSLGSGAWYRRSCLLQAGLRPGLTVVDVAIGTGLVAREALAITRDQGAVIGVDISEAMLSVARRKLGIPLIQGTAEALPLADDVADFVTMGYAVRHVADLEVTFREAHRVLRPNGTLLLLEIRTPRRKMARFLASTYIGGLVPFLSLVTTGDPRARTLMRYHWETIVNCVPPQAIIQAMSDSGFREVNCQIYFDLFCCYTGRKPPT